MRKPKVLITRRIAQEALDRIAEMTNMEIWQEELPPPYEWLQEKARDAEGLLTLLSDKIDVNIIDIASKLRVISNMAVGYDNIDINQATKRHILVGHTPGLLTETTADFTFALLMAAARRIVEANNYVLKGRWKTWGPATLLGQDIHHATLGIIGLGRIGTAVAQRAMGFKMRVLYYDVVRRSKQEEKRLGVKYMPELAGLLSNSDFVSVHVPLTPQTRHLIGAVEFAIMKTTAVFINTSRGSVTDQEALYKALKSGQIFSAGLDVTEIEPISPNNPLLSLDNIIIAPHIASASFTTRKNIALMAADNLLAGLRGELPPNCVNPEAFVS